MTPKVLGHLVVPESLLDEVEGLIEPPRKMIVGRIDILLQPLGVEEHTHRFLMGKRDAALMLDDVVKLPDLLVNLHVPALGRDADDGDGRVVVLQELPSRRDSLPGGLQTDHNVLQLLDLVDGVLVVIEQLVGGHLNVPLALVYRRLGCVQYDDDVRQVWLVDGLVNGRIGPRNQLLENLCLKHPGRAS